jgi:hypothetical protein
VRVALALCLVSALARAQTDVPHRPEDPAAVGITAATLRTTAGTTLEVGPGVYLRADKAVERAKEKARTDAENASLRDQAGGIPAVWVAVALGIGFLGGAAVALVVWSP